MASPQREHNSTTHFRALMSIHHRKGNHNHVEMKERPAMQPLVCNALKFPHRLRFVPALKCVRQDFWQLFCQLDVAILNPFCVCIDSVAIKTDTIPMSCTLKETRPGAWSVAVLRRLYVVVPRCAVENSFITNCFRQYSNVNMSRQINTILSSLPADYSLDANTA